MYFCVTGIIQARCTCAESQRSQMEGARGGGSVCQRSFTELAVEGFRMTSLATVILSPSAPSGPQGPAPRRGRISTSVAHRLAGLKLTHYRARSSFVL